MQQTPPSISVGPTYKSLLRQVILATANAMATNPDFVVYLRAQNLDSAQSVDVAEKPAIGGLFSAADSFGFYSSKGTDLHRWWNDQPGWQSQGNLLARLRHMFDNLQASTAAAKQQDALFMDPEVDNPSTRKPTTR